MMGCFPKSPIWRGNLRGGVGVENAEGNFWSEVLTESRFQGLCSLNRSAQILKSLAGLGFVDLCLAMLDNFWEFDGMIETIRANEPGKLNRFRVLNPGGCNEA